MVQTIDERQRNSGDYRSLAYLEQKEKDKTDIAREAIVYRRTTDREADDPLHQAQERGGQGLPAARQEPLVLRPDRRASGSAAPTASASPAPTPGARTSTSRSWRRNTTPPSTGEEKLGKFDTWVLELKVKPGHGRGLPDRQALGRQGHGQRPQAAGLRPLRPADAHALLPHVGEALQRIQEGRTSGIPGRSASTTRSRRPTPPSW